MKSANTQKQIVPWMKQRGLKAMAARPDLFVFGGAANSQALASVLDELMRQFNKMGLTRQLVTA